MRQEPWQIICKTGATILLSLVSEALQTTAYCTKQDKEK